MRGRHSVRWGARKLCSCGVRLSRPNEHHGFTGAARLVCAAWRNCAPRQVAALLPPFTAGLRHALLALSGPVCACRVFAALDAKAAPTARGGGENSPGVWPLLSMLSNALSLAFLGTVAYAAPLLELTLATHQFDQGSWVFESRTLSPANPTCRLSYTGPYAGALASFSLLEGWVLATQPPTVNGLIVASAIDVVRVAQPAFLFLPVTMTARGDFTNTGQLGRNYSLIEGEVAVSHAEAEAPYTAVLQYARYVDFLWPGDLSTYYEQSVLAGLGIGINGTDQAGPNQISAILRVPLAPGIDNHLSFTLTVNAYCAAIDAGAGCATFSNAVLAPALGSGWLTDEFGALLNSSSLVSIGGVSYLHGGGVDAVGTPEPDTGSLLVGGLLVLLFFAAKRGRVEWRKYRLYPDVCGFRGTPRRHQGASISEMDQALSAGTRSGGCNSDEAPLRVTVAD